VHKFATRRAPIRPLWVLLFVIAVIAVYFSTGSYGLVHYVELLRERQQLHAEILQLKQEQAELSAMAESLESDKKAIERVAREKYRMGKPDETLFLVPENK
jgi:cell division protein FtsB